MHTWAIVAGVVIIGVVTAAFVQSPSGEPDSKEAGALHLLFWIGLTYLCYLGWRWAITGH